MSVFTNVVQDLYATLPESFPRGFPADRGSSTSLHSEEERSRLKLQQWLAAISAYFLKPDETPPARDRRYGHNVRVGLIPRYPDEPRSGRGKFGIEFLIDAPGRPRILAEGQLEIAGHLIDVQFHTVSIEPHAVTDVGSGGKAGRSIIAKKGRTHGVLTARHVIQALLDKQLPIDFADGHSASAQDISWGSCEIDAAFVKRPRISSTTTITIASRILPGDAASIAAAGGMIHTHVTGVSFNPTGKHNLSKIPLYVWLDTAGQPGDSGTLISGTKNKGLGIYLGQAKGAAGKYGYAADLRQICPLFKVSIHA